MKKKDIHVPDDFDSVLGKIEAVEGSLDGLLKDTQGFALNRVAEPLLAGMCASLIVLHQVVLAMLQDETP